MHYALRLAAALTAVLFLLPTLGAQAPAPLPPAPALRTVQPMVQGALTARDHWTSLIPGLKGTFTQTRALQALETARGQALAGTIQAEWSGLPGSGVVTEVYSLILRPTADRKSWTLDPQEVLVEVSALSKVPLPVKNTVLQILLARLRDPATLAKVLPRAGRVVAVHVIDAYPQGVKAAEQSWSFTRPDSAPWRVDYTLTLPVVVDMEYLTDNPQDPDVLDLVRREAIYGLVIQRTNGTGEWKFAGLPLTELASPLKETAGGSWPLEVLLHVPTLATGGLDRVWGRSEGYLSIFGSMP